MKGEFNHIKIPFTILVLSLSLFSTYSCKKIDKGNNEIAPTVYYLNSETGDDGNMGTSTENPFKTISRINSINLKPGDQVLLAAGQVFHGSLILNNVKGNKEKPVLIASYGESPDMPVIDATGYSNAVLLENCSFVEIEKLKLTANGKGLLNENTGNMRCGILVHVTMEGNYRHIYLRNLYIKDIFFENIGFKRALNEVNTANGTQNYGWGIRFINNIENAVINDVQVHSCTIENVAHTGIKFTSRRSGTDNYGIEDIKVYKNKVIATGGPGIQMGGVSRGHIRGNYVKGSGSSDDTRKWGRGSGLWTWGSTDIIIEKNHFINASGPADSAGAHIDFNCKNIILQYNFSANNAGGFCEILGNTHNCAYRYNISVNDGYRVKGENNAFQEGKTYWLSGFVGNKPRSGPYNSYFYNNTIYVDKSIVSKIAVDKAASGALLMNNIFYIMGDSKLVQGDQYKPDIPGVSTIKNVVFENNLYLERYSWPKDVLIQDIKPLIGDPEFRNPGGISIQDYYPGNKSLIKDKGIEINRIPSDSIGLFIGLKVKYDILGNKIRGLPDLGAIELQ